jgi:hypothetical protein
MNNYMFLKTTLRDHLYFFKPQRIHTYSCNVIGFVSTTYLGMPVSFSPKAILHTW